MPVEYHIDSERNLVIFTAYGVLKEHEYKEIRAKLINDPHFRPGMDQISDFRDVEEHKVTKEGRDQFLDQEIAIKPLLGDYRQAIVAQSDLHFGLTRQLLVDLDESPDRTQVFYSMEEAQAWLFGKGST